MPEQTNEEKLQEIAHDMADLLKDCLETPNAFETEWERKARAVLDYYAKLDG